MARHFLNIFRRYTGPHPNHLPEGEVITAWHPTCLLLLTSLWLATLGNAPLWRELWQLPETSLGLMLGLSLLLTCAITAVLSLLAWARWALKVVLTVFLVTTAVNVYFMWSYGVVIDTTMVINVLQTDMREAADLGHGKLLLCVLLLAVVPSVWLWRQQLRFLSTPRQLLNNAMVFVAACAIGASLLVVLFQSFAPLMRNHTKLRYLINPLNVVYALGEIAAQPYRAKTSALLPLGRDATLAPAAGKPPLVLLVLGETARSTNFALNGYSRPTTPALMHKNVASQRNVWSCGTSTAASVPCMFSHLGRERFDKRESNYENLVDVLQHAGLAVLWLDNQSGCKGVCERVPQVATAQLCGSEECFDEVMLKDLEQRIAQLPAERRARGVVVFMHQMGSHGPAYYKRSPPKFKKFLPECTSNALQACERQTVINAYDNSIVYTDHFLALAINWLQTKESKASTAMVYVADHGESLGENNLYLHGLPYAIAPDVQKKVPWITWLSPAFEQRSGVNMACLQRRLDVPLSHDHYFSSVLGLLRVSTSVYQPTMDMYAACR